MRVAETLVSKLLTVFMNWCLLYHWHLHPFDTTILDSRVSCGLKTQSFFVEIIQKKQSHHPQVHSNLCVFGMYAHVSYIRLVYYHWFILHMYSNDKLYLRDKYTLSNLCSKKCTNNITSIIYALVLFALLIVLLFTDSKSKMLLIITRLIVTVNITLDERCTAVYSHAASCEFI